LNRDSKSEAYAPDKLKVSTGERLVRKGRRKQRAGNGIAVHVMKYVLPEPVEYHARIEPQ